MLDLSGEISWMATVLSIMVLGKLGRMIVVDLGVVYMNIAYLVRKGVLTLSGVNLRKGKLSDYFRFCGLFSFLFFTLQILVILYSLELRYYYYC